MLVSMSRRTYETSLGMLPFRGDIFCSRRSPNRDVSGTWNIGRVLAPSWIMCGLLLLACGQQEVADGTAAEGDAVIPTVAASSEASDSTESGPSDGGLTFSANSVAAGCDNPGYLDLITNIYRENGMTIHPDGRLGSERRSSIDGPSVWCHTPAGLSDLAVEKLREGVRIKIDPRLQLLDVPNPALEDDLIDAARRQQDYEALPGEKGMEWHQYRSPGQVVRHQILTDEYFFVVDMVVIHESGPEPSISFDDLHGYASRISEFLAE